MPRPKPRRVALPDPEMMSFQYHRGYLVQASLGRDSEQLGSVPVNADPNSDPQSPQRPRIPVAMPTSEDLYVLGELTAFMVTMKSEH